MKAKIVIAEDDPNILNLLNMFFRGKGYQVVTAENGEDALQKVLELHPDLLITDVMMPKKNGYQIVNALAVDHYDVPMPKIIMLTSRTDPTDIKRGLNVGVDIYIPKPFDLNEVAQHAEALLQES